MIEVSNKWLSAKAYFVLDSIIPSVSVWNECFGVNAWKNTHSKVIRPKPSLCNVEVFFIAQIC